MTILNVEYLIMKTKYERKGKTIKNIDDGTKQVFDSIALAKKESWKLQQSGGLGCGILTVEV